MAVHAKASQAKMKARREAKTRGEVTYTTQDARRRDQEYVNVVGGARADVALAARLAAEKEISKASPPPSGGIGPRASGA